MRFRLLPVSIVLALSVIALPTIPALAAVPATVAFQGRLATPDGAPVPDTTSQSITFRLYDAPTNGTLLWSQAKANVTVRKGLFTVTLDFSTGFTAGHSLESALSSTPFIEVQAGADPPMAPRLPLSSSPYALRAKTELLSAGPLDTPALLGSAKTGGYSVSVSASGSKVYVLNTGLRQLQVFDASNPAVLTLEATAGTGIDPSALAISGTYAYVVNRSSNTLQVFDISFPLDPTLKGTTTTGLSPMSVAVSGALAYVVNQGSDTLQVFDASDPTSPALKGSVNTGDGPQAVAIAGQTIYVVNAFGNTIQVFDASNPTAPVLRGSAPTSNGPLSVAVSGTYAYVVGQSNTLEVFDASNPAVPVLRGSAHTATDPMAVAISGNDAYVACGGDGLLEVFDVGDPSAPTSKGSTGSGIIPFSVFLSGGLAYTAGGDRLDALALQQMRVAGSMVVQGDASVAGRIGIGRGGHIGYPIPSSPDLEISNEVPGGVVRVLGTFVNASDARYKTDIGPITGALSSVLGLHGIPYNWRQDVDPAGISAHRQVGFIAQEVEKIRPDLVYTDANGYKSVSYVNVVPLLVEAVKEMDAKKNAEIAALRAQNRALEQRLQRLEERLVSGPTGPLRKP